MHTVRQKEFMTAKALLDEDAYLSTHQISQKTNISWIVVRRYLDKMYSLDMIEKLQLGKRPYWKAHREKGEHDSVYITLNKLLERGWTASLIQETNLKPVKYIENTNGEKNVYLYSMWRVTFIEKTYSFKKLKLQQQSSTWVKYENEKARLITRMKKVHISIKHIGNNQLTKEVIEWHNLNNKTSKINEHSNLNNKKINHIRHYYTNYEDILKKIRGKPGNYDAATILKERVNERIKEVYHL
jgi:hypothetical protein